MARPISRFFGPSQLADLCINEVIPEMVEEKLSPHQNAIRSILIKNNINSFNLQRICIWRFANILRTQTCKVDIIWPFQVMLGKLQDKLTALGSQFGWNHIAHAAAHEMNDEFVEIVHSLSSQSELKDFAWISMDSWRKKTHDILTDAEAKYLLSMIQRATAPTLTPVEDQR